MKRTTQREIERIIVSGLKKHLTACGYSAEVIMANQAGKLPPYPYVSYTCTTPIVGNAKKWCRASDGTVFRQLDQIWSFTVQSDSVDEADNILQACFEWFDYLADTYFRDHALAVVRILNIGNRDNMITIEYEYRRGFDVTISHLHVLDRAMTDPADLIESASISNISWRNNNA